MIRLLTLLVLGLLGSTAHACAEWRLTGLSPHDQRLSQLIEETLISYAPEWRNEVTYSSWRSSVTKHELAAITVGRAIAGMNLVSARGEWLNALEEMARLRLSPLAADALAWAVAFEQIQVYARVLNRQSPNTAAAVRVLTLNVLKRAARSERQLARMVTRLDAVEQDSKRDEARRANRTHDLVSAEVPVEAGR